MNKRTITFNDIPSISAARKAAAVVKEPAGAPEDREMLSARVNGTNARQFRAYAKLKGTTVQVLLDHAIAEYLERNRV